MADILSFIKQYENENIDVFLDDPSTWPPVDESREYLLTIDEEDRAKVQDALKNIVSGLKDYEVTLAGDKKELLEDMNKREQAQSACLSYLDQARRMKNYSEGR